MTPRVRNRHRVKERYASDPFPQSPIIRWNANSATLLNEVNRDAVLPDVRHDAAHKAVFEAAPAATKQERGILLMPLPTLQHTWFQLR